MLFGKEQYFEEKVYSQGSNPGSSCRNTASFICGGSQRFQYERSGDIGSQMLFTVRIDLLWS